MDDLLAGRYRLEEVLGKGGMGWVQRAYDEVAERWVAVKFLEGADKQPESLSTAFSWEVRAAAQLQHPNVVEVFDFGHSAEGAAYIIMSLSGGVALNSLSKRAFTWPVLCSILLQLCEALAHAHARGVYHHDLKPTNVLVHRDGAGNVRVEVIDFGIAAVLNRRGVGEGVGPEVLVGTASYLAPEAIRNFSLFRFSPALDIYAIGVITFELAQGRRPFTAEDTTELLRMHRLAPVPQCTPRPELGAPAEFPAFVERMLNKNPRQRYSSASAVLNALKKMAPRESLTGRVDARGLPRSRFPDSGEAGRTRRDPALARNHAKLLNIRPPPFAARDEELAYLWGRLTDSTISDRPNVVLVEGDDGVGVSRLLREVTQRAAQGGRARVAVVPFSLSGLDGVEGWRSALLRLLGYAGTSRRSLRHELVDDAEWLGLSDRIDEEALLEVLAPGRQSVSAAHLFDWVGTYIQVLVALASREPVLVVLEDFSPSDDLRGIEVLEFLLRVSGKCPVLVLLSTRRGAMEHRDLGRLTQYANFSRIEVGKLSNNGMTSLLKGLIPMDNRTRERLIKQSNGYPTVAVQLLRLLIQHDELELRDGTYTLADPDIALPSDLQAVWERRIKALVGEAVDGEVAPLQAILLRAAVLGQPFTFAALRRLLEVEERRDLLLSLGRAWLTWNDEGMWEQIAPGRAIFSQHTLWRAALNLGTAESIRRLHRLCAEARTAQPIVSPAAEVLAIAKHYLDAGMPGDAFPFLTRAAREAARAGRSRSVVEYCRQAADTLVADRADEYDRRWSQVYRLLSDGLTRLGRYSDAEAVAWRLEERAGHWGDPLHRATALRLVANSRLLKGQPTGVEHLLLEAHMVFESANVFSELARCELMLGNVWLHTHPPAEVQSRFRAARDAFEKVDDFQGIAQAYLLEAQLGLEMGELDRTRNLLDEAVERFRRLRDQDGLAQALHAKARVQMAAGKHRAARSTLAEAGRRMRSIGSREGVAVTVLEEGRLAIALGKVRDAEHRIRQAHGEFEALGHDRQAALARLELVKLMVGVKQFEEACSQLAHIEEILRKSSSERALIPVLVLLCRCRSELQRWPEADQALFEASQIMDQVYHANPEDAAHLEAVASITQAAKQNVIARAALQQASQIYSRLRRSEDVDRIAAKLGRP